MLCGGRWNGDYCRGHRSDPAREPVDCSNSGPLLDCSVDGYPVDHIEHGQCSVQHGQGTRVSIDFLEQLAEIYRLVDGQQVPDNTVLTVPLELNGEQQLIAYEKPEVISYNALKRELSNFIGSVSGLEQPAVDGHSARAALDVAMQIQDSIAKSLK